MPLSNGTRLGSFEILAPLGAGGMGEVYRARDSRLARVVAIKVLPAAVSADVERMARFQREAQVLASLNHPNIAAIYGVEDSGGSPALVMELVEGPTLADRIATGPIPLDDTLAIARQLAEALETAHEKGIIHRDLKPANIKVTSEGQVKVLDFGLAKAMADEFSSADPVNSPTLTIAATRAGVILGTAAYMPPEQAKGKTVDRRADIWAFGVVLYEMLTGSRGYTGDTAAETLAAVMKDELDWSQLPASTPAHIRRLLKRCMQKDPKRRLRDMGEARLALDEPEPEPATVQLQPVAPPPVSILPRRIPWVVAALLLLFVTALGWIHFREAAPLERVLRYAIDTPGKAAVNSFTISPDGRFVVIAASQPGKGQLWLRPLDTLQAQPMPSTEGASYPFWSPDSRFIGFFADGKLKKIAVHGGPPQSLCDAANGRGGTWNNEGTVVFAPEPTGGLSRVPAAGGVPVKVTTTKANHRFPFFLPDGRHFLYVVSTDSAEKNGMALGSLDGKENRRLLADMSNGIYVPPPPGRNTGHILFIRDANLMAQPFDDRKLEFAGELFPVAERISFGAINNFMPVSASANGILLFQSGRTGLRQQVGWFDRSGRLLAQVGQPGYWWDVSLAPDEKSAAVSLYGNAGGGVGTSGNSDIWIYEFSRGTQTRFTFHPSQNLAQVWSPKGDRIAFSSNRDGGHFDIYWKASSGAGQDEVLISSPNTKGLYDWSRDGRFLIYVELNGKTKNDLMVLPVTEGERKPVGFLQTDFNELQGQFSPDGHWVAYTSDESGRREIYVRPFPAADGKWKVSTDGGEQPRWRGDGKEIYFLGPDRKLYAAPVKAQAGPKALFEPASPVPLFDSKINTVAGSTVARQYDVAGDGKRFLVIWSAEGVEETPISVVVNWQPKNKGE